MEVKTIEVTVSSYGHFLYDSKIYRLSSSRGNTVKIQVNGKKLLQLTFKV